MPLHDTDWGEPMRDEDGGLLAPRDDQAEQALLGLLLLGGEEAMLAASGLDPEAFYTDRLRRIFDACRRAHEVYHVCDVTAVAHVLRDEGRLGPDDLSLLMRLTDAVPLSSDPAPYVAMLTETAAKRRAMFAGMAVAQEAAGGTKTAAELADMLRASSDDLGSSSDGVVTGEALEQQWSERPAFRGEPVPTGMKALDDMLGDGWRRCQFHLLSAPPKSGKSALVCSWMVAAVKSRRKVGILSLEMGRHEVISRMAAIDSGVPYRDVEYGFEAMLGLPWLSGTNYADLALCSASNLAQGVVIDDSRGYGAAEMVARLIALRRNYGCELLVVDLVNKVRGDGQDVHSRAADVCAHLDRACCEQVLGVPVIAVAQQNRAGEVKNAADFEESACAILRIKRTVEPDGSTTGELVMVDQRGGPTGTIALRGDVRTLAWRQADETARSAEEDDPYSDN